MTALKLIQQLESDTPHPVNFLYGKEDFFQRELIAKLTRRWITPDNRPYFSLTKFEVTSKTGKSTKSHVTLIHGLDKKW